MILRSIVMLCLAAKLFIVSLSPNLIHLEKLKSPVSNSKIPTSALLRFRFGSVILNAAPPDRRRNSSNNSSVEIQLQRSYFNPLISQFVIRSSIWGFLMFSYVEVINRSIVSSFLSQFPSPKSEI